MSAIVPPSLERFASPLVVVDEKQQLEAELMSGKSKSETDKDRKHDEADEELELELEDSFPASDPPSSTQPSRNGAPDHKGDKKK